ncbi:hypothetical protein ALC53_05310 [Atta colombica]|uniref:Uncharacterized protein n=1 Tax=Atta colombica TaxID=520822 RepID=A0A195BI45_9HYME|nr:hypothetical protein ALC53_05310 [Atta colombica]
MRYEEINEISLRPFGYIHTCHINAHHKQSPYRATYELQWCLISFFPEKKRANERAIRITALAARENEDSGRWHITSSPLNKTCQRPRKYKIVGYMRDGIKFHQALLLSVTGSFIAPHLQHQTARQPPQVHFVIYNKLLKLCYYLLFVVYFCIVHSCIIHMYVLVQGGTVYHRVLLPAVRLPYEANIDEIFFPNYANPFRD